MSELSEALDRQLRKIQAPQAQAAVVAKINAAVAAPSDKQVSFFKDLVARKQLTDVQRAQLMSGLQVFTARSISSTIQWLIALPWIPGPAVTTATQGPRNPAVGAKIDQGYYAVMLITLTDAQLLDESEKNQWLMGHIQMSPVDYKARYFACRIETESRLQIKRMLDNGSILCYSYEYEER